MPLLVDEILMETEKNGERSEITGRKDAIQVVTGPMHFGRMGMKVKTGAYIDVAIAGMELPDRKRLMFTLEDAASTIGAFSAWLKAEDPENEHAETVAKAYEAVKGEAMQHADKKKK